MEKILIFKNMNYKFIFKDFNLDIYENTLNLITGSNKCGKTTFSKILSGIIEVDNSYFYKGKDINELKSKEFSSIFSNVIFSGTFSFTFNSLHQEILFYLDKTNLSVSEKKMKYTHLVRLFNLEKNLYDNIYELSFFNKIKSLVLLSVVSSPKILILDNVIDDLSEKESIELLSILKKIGGMTILVTASLLTSALEFDYVHILDKGKVLLSDKTMEVLKQDSALNKLGLTLPFMVDLSLKLNYYDLVDDILLDMNRMVDKLWK